MQYTVAELGALQQVLWREHCPGAVATDERVINYLIDVSINGQVRTSGAQIARSIGEHPRTVTTSLIRLEMDDVITRGPYNAQRHCRMITIPAVVKEAAKGERPEPCIHEPGESEHCHTEAGPCDTTGHVHAGVDLPEDWAPQHWGEVFQEWHCQKEWGDLGKDVVRRWGAVMQHVHPSQIAATHLMRGIRISRPMAKAIDQLFTWTMHGPKVKECYRRECLTVVGEDGNEVPIAVEYKPLPTQPERPKGSGWPAGTAEPAGQDERAGFNAPTVVAKNGKAPTRPKPPTPPPPPTFVDIEIPSENEERWDNFLCPLGENFREGQRFLDTHGWQLFRAFLATCQPRHIIKSVREDMVLGSENKRKGGGGIKRPIAFMTRKLSWREDGKINVAPDLVLPSTLARLQGERDEELEPQAPEPVKQASAESIKMVDEFMKTLGAQQVESIS